MDFHRLITESRPKVSVKERGMFGRMFPELPLLEVDAEEVLALGTEDGPMDAAFMGPGSGVVDNPRIPAGFAFFGQFIAHDITNDRAPVQRHQELSHNYRKPRLDLEALYGSGPLGQPYLFDTNDLGKFLLGLNDRGEPNDLLRNHQGRAIVPDSRNDTYFMLSQLHLSFKKLHNRLVDLVRADGVEDAFSEVQRLERWHYQWVAVHDYLVLIAGEELVHDIVENGAQWFKLDGPSFVPVEFSDGTFRFGHAQLRDKYVLNDEQGEVSLFPDLVGARPVPARYCPDWWRFFTFPKAAPPQASIRIDAAYAYCLIHLPEVLTGIVERPEYRSLACRDLQRALATDLPSGEAIARAVGIEPLSRQEVGLIELGWKHETLFPLYVLREAAVQQGGQQLGEIGGRIVAEVLVELIRNDPTSYLAMEPDWQPTLPAMDNQFGVADLLAVADGDET